MTVDKETKKEIERFRCSCRMYFAEAVNVKEYLAEYPWLSNPEETEKHTSPRETAVRCQYEKMAADTKMVGELFDCLEEIGGIPIRVLFWKLLVEQRSLDQISEQYNMTRSQLGHMERKYLLRLFRQE